MSGTAPLRGPAERRRGVGVVPCWNGLVAGARAERRRGVGVVPCWNGLVAGARAERRRGVGGNEVLLHAGFSASCACTARTACPPNWLRSAATAFMVGESSCREEKRANSDRSEEHTSELQSRQYLVCRLLLEKKKKKR